MQKVSTTPNLQLVEFGHSVEVNSIETQHLNNIEILDSQMR